MSDKIRIQVLIIRPWEKDMGFSLSVSVFLWNSAMAPLPKDHDLPFGFPPHRTLERLMMRHKLCREMGQMFADALEQLIQRQDPKNGYAPGATTINEVEG